MAQRQNAHPHIMKDAPHLGKHGYVPDQKESQYQDSKYTYYNNVEIGRGKDFCQHLGIRARLFKEGITRACIIRVTPVINATQSVSINRSATTVPNDLEKEVPSYFARMPQREISPTRGTTRLAA